MAGIAFVKNAEIRRKAAMVNMKLQFTCECCKETLLEDYFPSAYQLPSGNGKNYLHICKDCVQKKINNFNPVTYLPLLKNLNVPFIADEWNRLINRYGFSGSIFPRYLSRMSLRGFRGYTWDDTGFLNNLTNDINTPYSKTLKLLISHIDVKYENAAKFYETYLAEFD